MSLPRYPEYKDSGLEWLGQVPAHWDVAPLKRSFQIVGGSTPKSDKAEYWDGPVIWVSPADLSKLRSIYINDSARKITEDGLASCGTTLVPAGSIVLSTRAPIGSLAIAATSLCTNQGCKALVPNNVANSRFFAFLLLAATNELNIRGKGTTFLELSSDELGAFKTTLPSPDEQTAIATFLDRETGKIDALIAEQEKLLALLAEKRQATISRAVTKGLNPNAPMKDSGVAWLGEVPRHWRVSPLKYLVTFSSGGTPSKENLDYWDGEIPWASAKDLKVERLHDTADHITQLAIDNRAASLLPAGTVLVVVRGMILARIFPVTQIAVPMAINQDLKGLRPTEAVDSNYLAWLLRGSADESLQRLDEAGHGTKALRMDAWSSMQLPVPPRDEQIKIASFLDAETAKLDALKDESERAIALLKERRSALIAAAVTGQIDVRQA